jgi:single-strand DNA-binding protein
MNKVILIGRLTKDPEVRLTQTGKKVATISIAVDDGKDAQGTRTSQYFNCSAWDSQAEILESYAKKGHRIGVIGKLQNRSWDRPDGTKGYSTDVQVRELELLTTRAEAEQISSSSSDFASGPNQTQSASPAKPATSSPTKPQAKKEENTDPIEELPDIDVDNINVQMPF